MSSLRPVPLALLLALLLPLLLPTPTLAATSDLTGAAAASEDRPAADESPAELTPWWELNPNASDVWKFGLLRMTDRHMRGWAVPVAIIGGVGLTNASVGLGFEVLSGSFFGDPGFLISGIVSLGVTAAMAGAAFPSLGSIKRAIGRYDDPAALHERLRKTRLVLGWTSLATGLSGLGLGLLAPMTFGITGIPAAAITAAAVMLGHASLTYLVFEQEVNRFVKEKGSRRRFGQLPRNPAPPRLVAASPMGFRFVF